MRGDDLFLYQEVKGPAIRAKLCEIEAKASFPPASGPAFISGCKPGGEGRQFGGR